MKSFIIDSKLATKLGIEINEADPRLYHDSELKTWLQNDILYHGFINENYLQWFDMDQYVEDEKKLYMDSVMYNSELYWYYK